MSFPYLHEDSNWREAIRELVAKQGLMVKWAIEKGAPERSSGSSQHGVVGGGLTWPALEQPAGLS